MKSIPPKADCRDRDENDHEAVERKFG